jgi:hypothetical protein
VTWDRHRSPLDAIRAVETAEALPFWDRLDDVPTGRYSGRRVWLFDPEPVIGRPPARPRPCCDQCQEVS